MEIKNRIINGKSPCYLIAEISHNHQGNEENALKIIREAAQSGANAVKFQKRDFKKLYSQSFYQKPYIGENSFGKTYGEHRAFLEPKIKWLKKANQLAHQLGLDFIMTVFDVASLHICEKKLDVDAYKIQSADLTSHYLIEAVASTKKPFFISCGASSFNEINETYQFCSGLNTSFCMMYAVSEYPTSNENANLKRITQLKKLLKMKNIGFSCHNEGIEPAVFARVLGVVAIEKHFTLDKTLKGPDHKLSLLSQEFELLKQKLEMVDVLMGKHYGKKNEIEIYERDARYKMGKSAMSLKNLKAGDVLKKHHIFYQSPMDGKNPLEIKKMIGKKLKQNIQKGEVIR